MSATAGSARAMALLACVPPALLVACARESAAGGSFVLAPVVAPAIEALEARVPPPEVPGAPDPETRERVEGLLGMLAGRDPRTRETALLDARSLPASAVVALVPVLDDPQQSDARRDASARLLGALGTPGAVEALCRNLEGPAPAWLRAVCAFELGVAGRDEVLPRMILRLRYEKDGATVVWLATALARLGCYAGLDGLLVLRAGGATEEGRVLAAAQLEELARTAGLADGRALVEAWSSPDPGLLELPAPSDALRLEVWRLVEDLGRFDLRRVDDGRFVLSRSGAWVAGILAQALHDSDVYVRLHAAQCLERMGPRATAAGPALLEALGEPRVAPAAAIALGAIGFAPAGPELDRVLRTPGALELRIAAARALGGLGEAAPRAGLRQVLEGTDALDLRQAAAEAALALGELEPARRFLVACLTDPAADCGAAEVALGRWLERAAAVAGDEGAARTLERWRSLGADDGPIPTADEVLERRRSRARLLESAPRSSRGPRALPGSGRDDALAKQRSSSSGTP